MKSSFFHLRICFILLFSAGISSASSAQVITSSSNDTIFVFENDSLVSFDDIFWGRIEQDSIVYNMYNTVIGFIDSENNYYDSESGKFARYDPLTGNITLADESVGGTFINGALKDKDGNVLFLFSDPLPVKLIGLLLFYFR